MSRTKTLSGSLRPLNSSHNEATGALPHSDAAKPPGTTEPIAVHSQGLYPVANAPWPVGRYRVTAKCYIPAAPGLDCEIQQPGKEIVSDKMPAWYLEPLDEGARLAWEDPRFPDHLKTYFDPIAQLPLTIGG